ncbi:hypothetical protein BJ170DRAFT_681339 [Xylariales sp. AK1849]|nr:hypothetical protein BJ170DRAFT_681339 [Xylariales sp. AK1849]
MTETLTKVDSAVEGLSSSPSQEKARRKSSVAPGVLTVEQLWDDRTPLDVAIETRKLGWKINTSPSTVEEKEYLKKFLTTPPLRKIDLYFPLGTTVLVRNNKGITIKDTLDVIYKINKKRADDELTDPYLEGFGWDGLHESIKDDDERKQEWTKLYVRLSKTPGVSSSGGGGGGGKKKKNKDKSGDE